MSSRKHTCNCIDCVGGREIREQYRHGGIDDGYEDTPYRKPGGKGWGSRRKRPCAKSKDGDVCDFSKRVVKGSMRNKERTGFVPRYIFVCARCGKEDWSRYTSWYW